MNKQNVEMEQNRKKAHLMRQSKIAKWLYCYLVEFETMYLMFKK